MLPGRVVGRFPPFNPGRFPSPPAPGCPRLPGKVVGRFTPPILPPPKPGRFPCPAPGIPPPGRLAPPMLGRFIEGILPGAGRVVGIEGRFIAPGFIPPAGRCIAEPAGRFIGIPPPAGRPIFDGAGRDIGMPPPAGRAMPPPAGRAIPPPPPRMPPPPRPAKQGWAVSSNARLQAMARFHSIRFIISWLP